MRVVIQRVESAQVDGVDDATLTASIGVGWLALVGVEVGDTPGDADYLADRVVGLRAFPDEAARMNRSVGEVDGAVLAVSNFTLAADCNQGRRPGFARAMIPAEAEPIFDRFVAAIRKTGLPVRTGWFGMAMRIRLVNQGPATFVLDSQKKNSGRVSSTP